MLQSNEFKIYNASAGAGKTYTLVKEFLMILLSNPNPQTFESILAITFTNKSAQEMKDRILKQLITLAKSSSEQNTELQLFAQELNLNTEILQKRANEILIKILHNYSRFSVSTIDKFNLRLMKSFAQDLGLSSNFNVEMDVENILEESVAQIFSKIGEDEILSSVLIEIALDNLDENRSWDLSRAMVTHAKSLYSDTHLEKLSQLQKYSLEEFNEFRKTVNQTVFQKKKSMVSIAEESLDFVKKNGISLDEFAYGTSGFIGFFTKIQNEKFDFPTQRQLSYLELSDEKKYVSGKASLQSKQIIPQIVPELSSKFHKIYEILKDLPLWEGIQKTIASLAIINEVEKSVENIKEDNNILLISEFNKLISSNLKDQPSGFIYERIGSRFHHYFIDEFQDTSLLQWQNLQPLIENARSGSDTVMIVGDPKQSIYRFRGGNPDQMMDLINKRNELQITVENLPKNWRSYENIIHFNNEFYKSVAQTISDENYQSLFLIGNNQLNNNQIGGYVQLNFIDKTEGNEFYQTETLEQILRNISDVLNQGFNYSDIAILHRTNSDGKLIAEFLAEHDVPIISSESLLLKNSPEIQLIDYFFRTISNPQDRVSMTRFLLKLNEMELIQSEDITKDIYDLLPKDFSDLIRYLKAYQLDISFVQEPSISLYDFAEKSFYHLKLEKHGTVYLQSFLDYVLEYSMQNEYNLIRFLDDWDKQKEKLSITLPDGIDAIQLLSIHKSKGLEFQVVLLPFADWGQKMNASNFWIPVQDDHLPFQEFMVDRYGKLEEVSEEIAEIIQKEKLEMVMDNLNLLYVATTRAVEQLYIITQKSDKEIAGVAGYFSSYFTGENEIAIIGEKRRISKAKIQLNPTEKIPFVYSNWEEKIQISKESSKRWKKNKEIIYGEFIHELIGNIRTLTDVPKQIETSVKNGFCSEEESRELFQKIIEIIEHPQLQIYFQENLKLILERDFIDENGSIYRPDRLVVVENGCTIIDYKTGNEQSKHIQQINDYERNLKNLGWKIDKKLLVYINDQVWVKEVK